VSAARRLPVAMKIAATSPEPFVSTIQPVFPLQLMQQLNGHTPERMRALRLTVESWFHIARRHGWFGAHDHPFAG
jgi:hypothetical protein